MTHKTLTRIGASAVFIFSFVTYLFTLAPTVVFWDVGEFIAAAKLLQVPHPPGSPLFLLGARVAMMIPFAADQAVRAHAFSALLSSLAVTFFYLFIVELFRGSISLPQTVGARAAYYGAAVIGALALALSPTYWDNSIEAEVYGASMFFLTAVLWLAMRWRARADEPGNEKHLMLMAYLIGLSLGVHLLALLAIFPVLMIVYFRRYEVTARSFAMFTLVALAVFFVVYPGIVKFLPGMMDGDFLGSRSVLISWIPWLVIAAAGYGVYATYVRRQKNAHLALLAAVLILLGYTTYTQVLIRANVHPPMNENNPNNLARLTSYLGREQYGDAPMFFPRRWSPRPDQKALMARNYSSDMDFLARYQLGHMFFRYVGWNFIGSNGDYQGAGVRWNETWGLPFFLALLGIYFQFRRDWKMCLVLVTMFVILGPVLALYQNQQEPQPRERDYFYVGAYLVMAAWIAFGVHGAAEFVGNLIRQPRLREAASLGAVGVLALAVPGNMFRLNYAEHNRAGNYVAWDFAYNQLQSCEKDAILFTNGDNDTFPLWYLQDVEGIRRDVRIVNLSLGNIAWYVQQLKDKPYYPEALPVPISMTDQQIADLQPRAWRPMRYTLPVPDTEFQKYQVADTAVLRKKAIEFVVRPTMGDYGIRGQDLLVLDILLTNQWKRPVYFATTCSPDCHIGTGAYLWFAGLVYKLEPRTAVREGMHVEPDILEANLLHEPKEISKTPQYGYRFRGINDPRVHFDENTTRLMTNFRMAFIELANYQAFLKGDPAKGGEILDRMEYLIPKAKIPMGWDLESDIASFYLKIGRADQYHTMMAELEPRLLALINARQFSPGTYFNPVPILLEYYQASKDTRKEYALLKTLQGMYPKDDGITRRLNELGAMTGKSGREDSIMPPSGATTN